MFQDANRRVCITQQRQTNENKTKRESSCNLAEYVIQNIFKYILNSLARHTTLYHLLNSLNFPLNWFLFFFWHVFCYKHSEALQSLTPCFATLLFSLLFLPDRVKCYVSLGLLADCIASVSKVSLAQCMRSTIIDKASHIDLIMLKRQQHLSLLLSFNF